MGLLRKIGEWLGLIQRTRSHEEEEGMHVSLLSYQLQQGEKVQTAQCAVHKTTFPLINSEIIAFHRGAFTLDAGGFCRKCRLYRCPKCTDVVEADMGGESVFTPGCKVCRTPFANLD